MTDQVHDFKTALTVTPETVAEAMASRVSDLERAITYMQSRALRWPREWTPVQTVKLRFAQDDLTRARADQEQHRNAAARQADTPAVTQGTAA